MKTFLEDLKKELINHNISASDIEEIISDHEEMIASAVERGLDNDEIKAQFGDPKALAKELADFSNKQTAIEQTQSDEFVHWQNFDPKGDALKIEIRLVFEDITFQPSKDDQIHVSYKGTNKIDRYDLSYNNHLLSLKTQKELGFLFMRKFSQSMAFLVEVPEHVIISDMNHNGVSSNLTYMGLDAQSFILNTTSGDIDIQGATFGDTKWNTVSGDIKVKDVAIVNLNSSQVSGDLNIENIKVDHELRLSTVSGDVDIDSGTCELLSFTTVSGDLDAKEFYPESVSLKSISGDIYIKNKEDKPINVVKKSSLSGKIRIK
ncbi:MAG: DUF4097 family beta strand repeat-containing protein [Acholeplasmataceae bacterium]